MGFYHWTILDVLMKRNNLLIYLLLMSHSLRKSSLRGASLDLTIKIAFTSEFLLLCPSHFQIDPTHSTLKSFLYF